MVQVLLKPGLENFEHYFTSMWDECNYAVVWIFFGIAFLWDWNENWPFPVLWPLPNANQISTLLVVQPWRKINDLQLQRWFLKNKRRHFLKKYSNIQSKLSKRSLIMYDFRPLIERILSDQKFIRQAHLYVLEYSKYILIHWFLLFTRLNCLSSPREKTCMGLFNKKNLKAHHEGKMKTDSDMDSGFIELDQK